MNSFTFQYPPIFPPPHPPYFSRPPTPPRTLTFRGQSSLHSPLQRQCTSELTSELAAQLLLLSIRWIKSIPSMSSIQVDDQLSLVAESWKELFVLAASQYQLLRTVDGGPKERKGAKEWKRKNNRFLEDEELLEVVDDDVTCKDSEKEAFNSKFIHPRSFVVVLLLSLVIFLNIIIIVKVIIRINIMTTMLLAMKCL